MPGTLVLATHGIVGGPGTAARHAHAIRRRGGWAQVRVGCLKAQPSLAEAMANQGDYPAYASWRASEDAQEGPRAFAEKRPPLWKGC